MTTPLQRCPWCGEDPLYVDYHDKEWGQPSHDDRHLFEMLCLEGQQAGLSWITVLRKREHYRKVFHKFDVKKVAAMSEADLDALLEDAGIIRHRGKLSAIRDNAIATLALKKEAGSLDAYFWGWVEDKPITNKLGSYKQADASTPLSEKISKDLKKRGFRFVGPTTIYAFMQAVGMVNDHQISCFRYAADSKSSDGKSGEDKAKKGK
jgi:DNA-3-methyladenine glycosylase I